MEVVRTNKKEKYLTLILIVAKTLKRLQENKFFFLLVQTELLRVYQNSAILKARPF
jgi:hypothetical protein